MSLSASFSLGSPDHTSSAPTIWVNGVCRSAEDAQVSARDRGFTLADGLFETMRVRHGRVFRLDRHLARLHRGLMALEIPEVPELREWVRCAVDTHSSPDAGVRLTVTRGAGPGGLVPPAAPRPTVVVAVGAMPSFPRATYDQGLTGHVASGRRNERAMTAGLKTLAYVDSVSGFLEAQRAGADEAIFLDTVGRCSEGSASNLFVWTGAELLTPPVSCGALPGVTREAVLELASALDVSAAEREFGPDVLTTAAEAFLTSSLRGIAPLVRIDGRPIGKGVPGTITRRFAQAYEGMVERECGNQDQR